jgi:predicted RNA-binding protein YlqC (UPF0109 family)
METGKDAIAKWLESIVQGLVNDQQAVRVQHKTDDLGCLFTITVNPENGDAGKVVGRAGGTAKAIRTLAYAAGYMSDMKASVKFDIPVVR